MGKLIKIILSLVVVVVIVAISLPFIIDPNDYRDEIISAVEKSTGRKLTIEGDLKLTVFPWVGIDLGKMALSNAEGFGDKPFAAISDASVHIKLLPLLAKEVVADTITLNGLQLNLAKNSKGVTNWADLAGDSKQPEKTATDQAGMGLKGLAIGGFSINNATIHWQDDMAGQSYQVKNFQLNSGAISPGDPVDLALAMDLESSAPVMSATLKLDGTVAVDSAVEKLTVLPLSISVDAKGDMFAGGGLKADLSTDITVNLKELAVSLQKLALQSGDLKLTGAIEAANLSASPQINGNLKLARLNLKKWLQSQGIALPEMANPESLSSFSADLKIASQQETIKVNDIAVMLDSSKLTGNARLAGPHTGFNLNVDQVNVDHYLPKAAAKDTTASKDTTAKVAAEKTSTNKTAAKTADQAPLFPVELLRTLDIDGTLTAGKMIISNLSAEKVKTHIVAKNGVITINKEIGQFYQGNFNGKTNIDVKGKTPKLSVYANMQNLQAESLLKDLANVDKMSGKGRFSMDIQSSGNSVDAIKKMLGGNMDFRFEDGAVKGINLAKVIRETKAKFEGKSLAPSNEPEQTDFSELSGSAKITNGVINNQDLLAKSPFLRVNGAGTVDLVKESLDYTVQTVIVGSDKGQGGESLKDLEGLNIPVKLTGPLTAPNYSVDWGKVLLSSQKAKVDEKVEEKKQELKQKLQDKLGDKLKGFF